MYKTCSKCGIVSDDHICPYKRQYKKDTVAGDIRHTNNWTKKSLSIRERDNYLCQVCITGKYDTINRYNSKDIEVYHIIPIECDSSKAFNNNNLISLCRYHHELAEKGTIPKEELIDLIKKKPPL